MHNSTVVADLIHCYSRAEAITDGVLIDVSAAASSAGFRVPVALTAGAWADCVAWSDADSCRQTMQDESARLWDVLWMASLAAKRGKSNVLSFSLLRIPRGGRGRTPRLIRLHMCIGPGDQAEPVITIMLPDEN